MSEKHSTTTSFVPQERMGGCITSTSICPCCKRIFWHRRTKIRIYCSKECTDKMGRKTKPSGPKHHCYKHGASCEYTREKLYSVWMAIKDRCRNPRNPSYLRYGGKGISICQSWSDYSIFRTWAITNGYAIGLTIDRIDNSGNYCPENCRIATRETQTLNRVFNHIHGIRKRGRGWDARIMYHYKEIHLGSYPTIEDAARAYDKKAKELWGDLAQLNFPDETT